MALPGTPVRQLFKQHRVHSPLHEMDGLDDDVGARGSGTEGSGASTGENTTSAITGAAHGLQQHHEQGGDSLTFSSMARLLEQHLAPIRQDISAIKLHGVSRDDLDGALQPIMQDMEAISQRVEVLEAKSAQYTPRSDGTEITQGSLQNRLAELETMMKNLSTASGKTDAATAVFGGLDGLSSLEEAEKFIKAELRKAKVSPPVDIFIKGDTFSGLVFGKMANPDDLQTVVH
eukprot:9199574-Pyramimonas_sp.AAC.1